VRDLAETILRATVGLASVLGVLLVFLLVNGGYVYRTECPRAGGSTETDWSYRIYQFIPYLGYSRSGCESHTATRVALDAIGVWKLDDDEGVSAPTGYRHEYLASDITRLQDNCEEGGRSESFCRCMVDELTLRFSRAEATQLANAVVGGTQRYDELPSAIRDKAYEFGAAVDRDC